MATAACAVAVRHLLAGTICRGAATVGHAAADRHLVTVSSVNFRNFSNFRPVSLDVIFFKVCFFAVVYSRPYRLYKLILHFVVNKFGGMKWWTVSLVFAFIFKNPVGEFCVLKMFS